MKKYISTSLIFALFSNPTFADCDWTQIKKLPDGGYEYNTALNLCVGQLVQDNKTKDQQISDLNKAIELKNLAINFDEKRVEMWQKSSEDMQDRLVKYDSDQKLNNWVMFGLGVATTFLAAYGASKLVK